MQLSDADVFKCADALADSLWPTATSLFVMEAAPGSRVRSLGSGVLVRALDSVFILSAAHVLAHFKETPIWLRAGRELVCLPGGGRFSLTGSSAFGDHENDPVDAGVLFLPLGTHDDLLARALNIPKIETESNDSHHQRFLLLGYPANRVSVDRVKMEIRSEEKAYIYTEVPDAVYLKLGYDKAIHLLLDWKSRLRTPAGSHHARSLLGSSGGGIWRFQPHVGQSAQLMATFTALTLPRHGRRVLVGTLVHRHLELARSLKQSMMAEKG